MLERYFIYQTSYAITQVSSLLSTYSLKTVIYSYCKATCAIVLLIIQISLSLVLRFPLSEKTPSSFFNFGSIRRRKKLNFRGSEHLRNYQFFGAFRTYSMTKLSSSWFRQINKQ